MGRRLDSPLTDTGSSIAALLEEYRVTMAIAREGITREVDPLQVLQMWRAARLYDSSDRGA